MTSKAIDSLEKFTEVLNKQNEKGLEKYGQALDPLDRRYDFLEMILEELIDGVQYARAEQLKRKHIAEQIRKAIKGNSIGMVYDKVDALLVQLVGKQ